MLPLSLYALASCAKCYCALGLPEQGHPGHRPPIPTGVRPPMPNSIPSQAFNAGHLMPKNLGTPGPNDNFVKDLRKDGHTTLSSNNEAANVDNKVIPYLKAFPFLC